MHTRVIAAIAAAALICTLPATALALTGYAQNFEGLVQTDPDALGNDGWWVYGNVFQPDGTTYIYGYGPYAAPNHNLAFCQIVVDEGGDPQGLQQLVVFSDYENTANQEAGNIIESNVFHEQTIGAADVGTTWIFAFDAKLGNIEGASQAKAFIKTLDPGAGYALTNFITEDMTSIPVEWHRYGLSIEIDETLEGQILQFGFLNTATLFEGSGIFYDNVNFYRNASAVPGDRIAVRATLGQNYPNPFNPSTRIDFTLERDSRVELAVFDLAGRRVATLHAGPLAAGAHHATWDGRTDAGNAAPAGQYRYVLTTPDGLVSRSMVLLK